MKRKKFQNIFLFICSVLVCLIIGEIVIRKLGHYTIDGNFFFFSRQLKPYYVPIRTTQKKINRYISAPTSSIMYDPTLGWAPRPSSKSNNGLYNYNSDGIRMGSTDSSTSRTPQQQGTLRITIFGDSFTHGDDVSFKNTWGYYLEKSLKETGIDAEVLNFGVGGYGIDQAFLRWKKLGYKFSPHIVIFGFQPENVKRNVNLIRPIMYPETGLPLSKPKYVLEKDKLKLINVPTLQPKN